jgi:hypothetical protein
MVNLRGVVFGIAVFILTMFVATYGVDVFYSDPEYEDFCSIDLIREKVSDESSCLVLNGSWISHEDSGKMGFCDINSGCQKEYDRANKEYSKNIFLVSIPLGILILIGGFFVFGLEFVSVGVMLGGVGTMLRGIGGYWRYSDDWLKFLISLVGLGVVIYFSYRFSEKLDRKK